MGNLILVDHFIFLHFLYRYDLASLFVSANSDFAESSTTDDFQRFKITHGDTCSSEKTKSNRLGSKLKDYFLVLTKDEVILPLYAEFLALLALFPVRLTRADPFLA